MTSRRNAKNYFHPRDFILEIWKTRLFDRRRGFSQDLKPGSKLQLWPGKK